MDSLQALGWRVRLLAAGPRGRSVRALKKDTGGMLRTREYQLLSYLARRSPAGCFVEVGAAYGTSTIVLALAMRSKAVRRPVVTFEKGLSSSCTPGRIRDETLGILRSNLERHGVAGEVEVRHLEIALCEESRLMARACLTPPIALLFLDAGGEVYRDLYILHELMARGCIVAIDDYCLESELASPGIASGRQKFIKTRRYVDRFVAQGLIEPIAVSKRTFFGRLRDAGSSRERFTLEEGKLLQREIAAELAAGSVVPADAE